MELEITQPDDWHLHLRDGELMKTVLAHTAQTFGRAIIMPNLKTPITTVKQAQHYYQQIKAALASDTIFEPLMTLYLTESSNAKELTAIAKSTEVKAVKYYPAGATTNSDSGVRNLEKVYPFIEQMEKLDIPLLVHGEVVDSDIDVFDREKVFIDKHLIKLVTQFPSLRIVFEHITTQDAAQFVKSSSSKIAATITPQHMLMNRNELFRDGINPHHYCLPILKREKHRQAIVEAACSGNRSFFLGTDSAPHFKLSKESSCGCAGIYSAPIAMALYAEAFDNQNSLDKLEAFASLNGANFYGLELNEKKIRLVKQDFQVEKSYLIEKQDLIPLRAGKTCHWRTELV